MKNKFLLFLIFVFFIPFALQANHVVGGSLTYQQVGSTSSYNITLKLYRDCKAGNTGFPANVQIEIVTNDGTPFTSVTIPLTSFAAVIPEIDSCAVDPGICLEEAIYTQLVPGLVSSPGGYHLYFQLCCRNNSIDNISNPSSTGDTWYTHIPDNGIIATNSSPTWASLPPVFICQGSNMSVDHSATDADGDSLTYSFYTPYDGDPSITALNPTYPGNVFTVPTINWASTFGANNPLNAGVVNSLTISSAGMISGIPPSIGQFIVGIRCEEWRAGVKIGEILRDFQFNVVNCPTVAVPNFTSSGECSGQTITFNNTTTPATATYFWNFGDGTTSTLTNPVHNYAALNTYLVTLFINKGTACADSVQKIIKVSYILTDFNDDAPNCQGVAINFNDATNVDPLSSITNWTWHFGDGTIATTSSPTHIYNTGGTFSVKLITTSAAGCVDSITHLATIQGFPVANAGNDTMTCANNAALVLNGSIMNAGGGIWMGTGNFSNNTIMQPTYTPLGSAILNGTDTLLLISTSNGFCPVDTGRVIIHFSPAPTIFAGSDQTVCQDTTSIPLTAAITGATGVVWHTLGTGTFLPNNSSLNTSYKPSAADTSTSSVTLYCTTSGNGNCLATNDSVKIFFTSTPIVSIISSASACKSNPVVLSASTSTATGTWTSNGTGTFAPNTTSLNTFYNPSAADDALGTVKIIFTSTNNAGCKPQRDTIDLILDPSPVAAYTSNNACPAFPVTFTDASTVSLGSIVAWNWNFGDSGTANSTPISHTYTTGGAHTITLIVTASNGCVDTLQQVLNVFSKPEAGFTKDGICLKNGTIFNDTSIVAGSTIASWNWNFGDGTVSISDSIEHHYQTSGPYTVRLIVQSAQGCIDTATQQISIVFGPTANFTADNYTTKLNQLVNFTDHSTNAYFWYWHFGDMASDSTSTSTNPSHGYSKEGVYNVTLIVTDNKGCTDTIVKQETVSQPPSVPTAFTPNGDSENDVFYVYGGPFKSFVCKIYNSWGNEVFESNKQSEGWDGKFKGADQAIGVYIYVIVAVTEDGEEHKLSGDVTLLR
jgi:gliding motility-associated-like protein